MKYFYILSVIFIILSFLFLRTSKKEKSIIVNIIYTVGLYLCFNVFIVFVNYYLNIGSSLLILSIINIILSIIFFVIIKFKGRQKYYFKKEELFGVLILTTILFIICLIRFNCFNNISYESGDSSIHYKMALHFRESMNLLDENNSSDLVYSFNRSMTGYYVNAGLFMKLLDNYNSYKVYMLFDSLFFILLSCLFLITIYSVKKEKLFLVIIVSLLYALGYPLNNLIFGYGYLGMGILTINMIFITYILYSDWNKNLLYKNILLFIINFSIFFSYSLFVPIIYLGEGLYYLINYFKKKIKFKELVIYLLSLVIPFVLGFIYFIIPMFINSNGIDLFKNPGYIYKGIICLFAMMFLVFTRLFKDKNYGFGKLIYLIFIFVLFLFSILMSFCGFESYYYYKLYYIIWLVCFVLFIQLFDLSKIKNKLIIVFGIVLLSICSGFFISNEDNILSKNLVYVFNFSKLKSDSIVTDKELEIINESIKYTGCVENNRFYISSSRSDINLWYYAITNRIPNMTYFSSNAVSLEMDNLYINDFDKIKNKCLIYLFRDNEYIDYSKYKKLYENEAGVILEKE